MTGISRTSITEPADGTISGYLEAFLIGDPDDLLECATSDCTINDGEMWVKFTEDGQNNSEFTNTDGDDVPSIKTTAGAQRDLSFEFEYDNGVEGGIGFSTTTITINTDGDWGSGEVVSVTLTDPDANTNSLTDDDLSVRNPDQTIPTIKIGNPLTLAEADSVTLNGDDVEYRITPVSEMLVVDLPALEGGTTLRAEDRDRQLE